jgi:hypothetical protein
MCAFTHGGAVQVKAQAIGRDSPELYGHAYGFIDRLDDGVSYLGTLGIAAVADDGALAEQLHSRHEAIYSVMYRRS